MKSKRSPKFVRRVLAALAVVALAATGAALVEQDTLAATPVTLNHTGLVAGGTYADVKVSQSGYLKVKGLVPSGFAVLNPGASTVTLRWGTFDRTTTPVKVTDNPSTFGGTYVDQKLTASKFNLVAEDLPPGIDVQCSTCATVTLHYGSTVTSPTPTTTTPPPTGNTIAVIGDICGPECNKVAALIKTLNPDLILTTGDNAYPDGSLSNFNINYDPSFGQFKSITRPVPGNHDHHTANAQGFRDYFGRPLWYGFDFGGWHFVGLDSELYSDSTQKSFFTSQLNGLPTCSAAYWHVPLRSDALHGDADRMKAYWQQADAAGVDVVFEGHDHLYERYAPMDASRTPSANGIRGFVVGTGGASNYSIDSTRPNLDAYFVGHGALLVTLGASNYSWKFYAVDGSVKDSGTASCTG